jgi:hypothetical protein
VQPASDSAAIAAVALARVFILIRRLFIVFALRINPRR